MLLNSPNNPTGAVIQYEDLLALCDFVTRHDLYLVSDEVYYNIIFDGMKFWSPAMIDGMKDRTIIIQSFSKTYAMTGWPGGSDRGHRQDQRELLLLRQHRGAVGRHRGPER